LSVTLLPDTRIATRVKARHDEYRIIDEAEEEGVRESAQQRAADIGKHKRKLKRIGSQPLGDLIERCDRSCCSSRTV